jgi:hypothetical protein
MPVNYRKGNHIKDVGVWLNIDIRIHYVCKYIG